MKNTLFTGAATAMITPFCGGRVDFDTLGLLIDRQIELGINALVVAATTGENPTLTDEEHLNVVRYSVERVAGRVPVIAGTGSNNTEHACFMTRESDRMGADGLLLVTPYYNKTTQQGLIESFRTIAACTKKPCILYNVPSRTGLNMLPATVAELAKTENITGIKEASGNITQIADIAALCGDCIDIYSGNDDQIVPILALGGKGVISTLSNCVPAETAALCRDWFEGRHEQALAAQLRYLSFIHSLFCEVNPIPVKAACAAMGLCGDSVRLPLVPMGAENRAKMLEIMKGLGLLPEA